MYFSKEHITRLERIKRINLINSITGIKPVLLIGTKSNDNISNLAIFSSIVHISSNPSLFGFFIRTNSKIRRDTYENIMENSVYTFNHIHSLEIRKSHFTSIKFQKNISEFDRCKFTEQYLENFSAPFVLESNVKIGLKLKEVLDAKSNSSKLIIGEVQHIFLKEKFLDKDFHLNVELSDTISVGGLNNYYKNYKVITLPYARLNQL